MKTELYVGALPYSVSESQLQEIFLAHGTVESSRVIKGRFTGQSRGFGFVVMSSQAEAGKAIEALNDTQVQGRTIVVREARLQMIRKILAPTDLSVKSIAGMAYAISLARENSAELLFLHVASMQLNRFIRHHFENEINQLQWCAVVRWGGIPSGIISVATGEDIDLIVMGKREREIMSLFSRSISKSISRRVHCPVVSIRPPLEDSAWRGGPLPVSEDVAQFA
jgi:nucleotide-binding universal stress UspA family protein